jgi:hypothetical protein
MPMHNTYMQDSLELNLFYLRIMKEHALFLQLGFTPKNKALASEAENLRKRFNELLRQAIRMSKGYVSEVVMTSGELFTRYTEEAERQTQFFTGVPIDSSLTREEYNVGGGAMPPPAMKLEVDRLNRNAMSLTRELLGFKQRVREDVLAFRIFSTVYPLQLEHIIEEAEDYIQMLETLMSGDLDMGAVEFADAQEFWNDIMEEHAEFINGLLDPTEMELKNLAQAFADQFENLAEQAAAAKRMLQMLPEVTMKSEAATENIRNFKAQATNGILSCSIRSIIIPLLSDHVLREASFYLRVLNENMR